MADGLADERLACMQEYDTYLAHMYLQTVMEQPESDQQLANNSPGASVSF